MQTVNSFGPQEIIAYANKRYNAGLTQSCVVETGDEYAFVDVTEQQVRAIQKTQKTLCRLNGLEFVNQDPGFSSDLDHAIEVKIAEQELQELGQHDD